MPRSHICPGCTTELARIRAVPDPIYALPVVVCPSCQRACVRVKHPEAAFWRRVRATRRAWARLLGVSFVMLVLTMLVFSMILHLTDEADVVIRFVQSDPIMEGLPYALFLLFVILLSTIARAWFSHHPFLVFLLTIVVLLLLGVLTRVLIRSYESDELAFDGAYIFPALMWSPVVLIPVFIGGAIGELLIKRERRSFWKRVNKARRKRRKALAT